MTLQTPSPLKTYVYPSNNQITPQCVIEVRKYRTIRSSSHLDVANQILSLAKSAIAAWGHGGALSRMVKIEIRYNYNLDIARSIIRRACIYRYQRSLVLFLLRDVVFQGHFQLLSVLLCCCSLFLRKSCRKLTLKAVQQQQQLSISPTLLRKYSSSVIHTYISLTNLLPT